MFGDDLADRVQMTLSSLPHQAIRVLVGGAGGGATGRVGSALGTISRAALQQLLQNGIYRIYTGERRAQVKLIVITVIL